MNYYIGIDLGTSSCKGILLNRSGAVLADHSVNYPVSTPYTNWSEQDPADWYKATVEILKVYEHTGDSRDLMLKVTDPRLLAQTGGIVQGMSGSPILQDGKLVGAVTHVLIDHADRGYGIFAQRMLEQADRTRSA